MTKDIKKIKEYWDSQAEKYGQAPLASTQDTMARTLESAP